jgi:hypothetical protein
VAGGGDFFGWFVRGFDAPLHIALAAADPDFSDKDIVEADFIGTLDDHVLGIGIGRHGVEADFPCSFGVGGDLFGLSCEGDRDFFTGIGPAPDRHGFVPLEHHMGIEDRGQRDGGGEGRGEENRKGGRKEERSHGQWMP